MIEFELPVIPTIPGEHHTPPCDRCTAACCRYFAVNIAAPTEPADFDHFRWMIFHHGVLIYEDTDGQWYLQVYSPCSKLTKDGKCSIYDKRPLLCEDYGYDGDGNVWCEAVEEEDNARYYRTEEDIHVRFREWYKERFGVDLSAKKIVAS